MAIDLAKLKSLHAAATRGEWRYEIDHRNGAPNKVIMTNNGDVSVVLRGTEPMESRKEIDDANYNSICALHNAAPALIARAELLEWLIREMRMIPEVEHGDAGVVVLYDEYIAPWMDEIEKRYREMEAQS